MSKRRTLCLSVFLCLTAPPLAAQTFIAGPGLGLAVPDNLYNGALASMACHTINVPSGGGGADTVFGVTSVTLRLSHTWIGDLTVKLRSPAGTVATLLSRPGVVETADDGNDTAGFGENSNLAFDHPITLEQPALIEAEQMGRNPVDLADGQTVCLDGGTPCNYNPNRGAATGSDDLSLVFDGENRVGGWQLCLGDSAAPDVGTLDGWTLNFIFPVELESFTVE